MDTQVWVGPEAPAPEKLAPVSSKPSRVKPAGGGLWTSTWDARTGSDWIEWCRENEFRGPTFDAWLLTPDPSARVYEVDSLADLIRLVNLYPTQYTDLYDSPCVDWAEVASEWDAVHLTEEGQWRTRLSDPVNLYGWDCESTLWFRWSFTSVEHHGMWEAAAEEQQVDA